MEILGLPIAEWVGYAATVILLSSFTMKTLDSLRVVNSVACLMFIIYGILLSWAWPIVISNAAIFVINMYYLIFKKKE